MCGRYALLDNQDEEELRAIIDQLNRRPTGSTPLKLGDIAPTALAPVLCRSRAQRPGYFLMRWGFACSFSATGRGMVINARSETALQKPLFRDSMRERRCLMPASGYYEWAHNTKSKTRYFIRSTAPGLCRMAGLYRLEMDGTPSFTILTRPAAPDIAFIHDRMPVLLSPADQDEWLSPNADVPSLLARAQTQVLYRAV